MTCVRILLLLCLWPAINTAFPFMPRFPDIEPNQPVLKPLNSSITWVAGTSDKFAYADRCQILTIRIGPEFMQTADDSIKLNFNFTCKSRRNLTQSQGVAMIFSRNHTRNETTVAKVCGGILPRTAPQLIRLNTSEYLLRPSDCSIKEYRDSGSGADDVARLTVTIVLIAKVSNATSEIRSNSLTVIYLSKFIELNGKPHSTPWVTKTAIDKISEVRDSDESLWNIPLLTHQALKLIDSLPLYLKLRLNIGILVTTTDCSRFGQNDSVTIVTNQLAQKSMLVPKNSTIAFSFARTGVYYIDLKTGRLYSSNANLLIKFISTWSRLPVSLKLCEFLQFSGHSTVPYTRELIEFFFRPLIVPNVQLAADSCQAVPGSTNALSPIEFLEGSGSPGLAVGPFVCSIPRNLTCKQARQSKAASIVHYNCEAGSAKALASVRMSSPTRFLWQGNASLPARVFAMEGESLSYSCSALVSDRGETKPAAVIIPVVFVPLSSKTRDRIIWRRLNGTINGSSIAVTKTQEAFTGVQQTLTVTVPSVPSANDNGNFTHRFVCQLTSSPDDARRIFGVPRYISEVGTDVVFVPRPTDESFRVDYLNETTFVFAPHPLFVAYLAEVGAQVAAAFRLGASWLNASHPLIRDKLLATSYLPETGSLILRVSSLPTASQLSNEILTDRQVDLVAVFSFRYPSNANIGSLRTLAPVASRRLLGSVACVTDPRCFYTTDYEGELSASSDGAQVHKLLTVSLDLS